jgi:hypothetical protein
MNITFGSRFVFNDAADADKLFLNLPDKVRNSRSNPIFIIDFPDNHFVQVPDSFDEQARRILTEQELTEGTDYTVEHSRASI